MRRVVRSSVLVALILLVAAPAYAAQNTLRWTDNSTNEDGFKIERKLGPIGSTNIYAQIATTGIGVATFVDSTVAEGTEYCYRVRAWNTAGDSAYSNEACRLVPRTVPSAPTGLGVTQ